MVVLLILAILLAIAIPTFLGVTKSANDRAAQSNLNTALVNAKASVQQNGQSYTGVNTTTLSGLEPTLTFTTGTIGGFAANVRGSVISMYRRPMATASSSRRSQSRAIAGIVADNTQTITNSPTVEPDHVRECHGHRCRAARCRYAVRQGYRHYR